MFWILRRADWSHDDNAPDDVNNAKLLRFFAQKDQNDNISSETADLITGPTTEIAEAHAINNGSVIEFVGNDRVIGA